MTSASAFGVQRSRSLSFTVGLLLITFLPLSSVPDPGLERSWGPGHPAGGAGLQKRFGPQFGLKIRGGGGGGGGHGSTIYPCWNSILKIIRD